MEEKFKELKDALSYKCLKGLSEQNITLAAEVEALKESVQVLDLENRKLTQDLKAMSDVSAKIVETIQTLFSHQSDMTGAVNEHTNTLIQIMRALMDAGIFDPENAEGSKTLLH